MKNSIYLIKSNDSVYIDESIKNILRDQYLDDEALVKYDLEETNVSKVIEDLDTYGFLQDRKVVVAINPPFLSSKQIKTNIEHDDLAFARYIASPNPDNVLIVVSKSFSSVSRIAKQLLAVATIYEKELNLERFIESKLGNLYMNNYTINYFINFCNKDSEKIANEINKLIALYDEGEITSEMIDEVCYSSYEDNVFKFLDELTLGNKTKALRLYENLLGTAEDEMMILALTNDHFSLLLNVKNLDSDGYKPSNIMKELNQKSQYRIDKMLSYKNIFTASQLLKILDDLCEIDIANKTNKENTGLFEAFIIEL